MSISNVKKRNVATEWYLYLLFHKACNRTYLGVTTNVTRRVRQHQCQISGGARFTTKIQKTYPNTPWMLIATLSLFSSKSEVTRWERLLKLKTRGLKCRLDALKAIGGGSYPKEFTPKMREKYQIPEGLTCKYYEPLIDAVE